MVPGSKSIVKQRWFIAVKAEKQRGQALIYGIFVLIGGLAALFFLFNTGQLAREKTKLVNTADAVAYSGGVMNARALNYQAYANRAMVANTVAIAQLVSLSSWIEYANSYGQAGQVAAAIDQETIKYFLTVAASNISAQTLGSGLQESLNVVVLEDIAKGLDIINWVYLQAAQRAVFMGTDVSRLVVMNEVANANYANDGSVTVVQNPTTLTQFAKFTKLYEDGERTRFAEVASRSAAKDPFVSDRNWRLNGLFSSCLSFPDFGIFNPDYMDRRGGTTLVGFDEWSASDSLTEYKRRIKYKKIFKLTFPVGCEYFGTSNGYGDQSASVGGSASSASWGYRGLPPFMDLQQINPDSPDEPKMLTGIRLTRNASQTQTSEARSSIKSSARLNNYQAQMAGSEQNMAAVSTSEVFFERHDATKPDSDPARKDNSYGAGLGRPKEIGSLFNPYWQVKLVQTSAANVSAAQFLQGVFLP